MLQINKLKVLDDLVLVEGIKPETVGKIIKGISQDDKPSEGKVLKVGPGRFEDGYHYPMTIKEGMHVLFNEHTTTKFNIDGKTYYSLHEEDCVAYEESPK
jgi:chaperonin GroES